MDKRRGVLIPTKDRHRSKDYDADESETLDGVTLQPLQRVFYLSSETMQGYNANTVGKILRDRDGIDPEVTDVAWQRCEYLDAMTESLHHAISTGNARLVQKRISEGADPNGRFNYSPNSPYMITPLMRAARQGYCKVAECLLDGGPMSTTPTT